jgi:hypothetical protein
VEFFTINRLVNLLREISLNHAQVKAFNFGENSEIAASEQERYPLVWAYVTDSSIDGLVLTVNMTIKVIDIQKADAVNEIDLVSDTLSIAQDIYAMLTNPLYQDYFLVQFNSSFTPLNEAFTDVVDGWEMSLAFDFLQDRNRCQVPTISPTTPVTPTCTPSVVLINGEYFISIPSGATQDVLLVNQDDVEIVPESIVGNKITIDLSTEINIRNSNNTYNVLATESPFILPDTDYNINVNGVFYASTSLPTLAP